MNNKAKIVFLALILMANGLNAAFMSKAIREGTLPWYWSFLTSFISASVFAYQLRSKMLPLTVVSVFQSFFFNIAWYSTAFFILNNELKGHKIVGLILAFTGMMVMSL